MVVAVGVVLSALLHRETPQLAADNREVTAMELDGFVVDGSTEDKRVDSRLGVRNIIDGVGTEVGVDCTARWVLFDTKATSQSRLEQTGMLEGQDEQDDPDKYGRPLAELSAAKPYWHTRNKAL